MIRKRGGGGGGVIRYTPNDCAPYPKFVGMTYSLLVFVIFHQGATAIGLCCLLKDIFAMAQGHSREGSPPPFPLAVLSFRTV